MHITIQTFSRFFGLNQLNFTIIYLYKLDSLHNTSMYVKEV
jgi:hypothetical protein